MKKVYNKSRLAIAVAFALSLSTLGTASLPAYAAQTPVNADLGIPFGQVADYNAENGIGLVWGAAGYDQYTVTISCARNGYEKVYPDQTLGYHWYPDTYEDGEYLIEIQGQRDGELSGAATAKVAIGNPEETPAGDTPGKRGNIHFLPHRQMEIRPAQIPTANTLY